MDRKQLKNKLTKAGFSQMGKNAKGEVTYSAEEFNVFGIRVVLPIYQPPYAMFSNGERIYGKGFEQIVGLI